MSEPEVVVAGGRSVTKSQFKERHEFKQALKGANRLLTKRGKSRLNAEQLFTRFQAYGEGQSKRLSDSFFGRFVTVVFCDEGYEFVLDKRSGGSGFQTYGAFFNKERKERMLNLEVSR